MFNFLLRKLGLGSSQPPQQSDQQDTPQQPSSVDEERRGSAMLLVVSLMGALLFLGLFFFSFVNVELNSAQWFSLNSKEIDASDDSDIYFDWALEQLILGPRSDQGQSALYGLKHSLVPGLVGSLDGSQRLTDAHVFSGRGVKVTYPDTDNDGIPDNDLFDFDYNHDGTNDGIILNFSPAANNGSSPLLTNPDVFNYEPDVGYTYPDINNLALAHLSYVDVSSDPTVRNLRPVWIPSFHRPQYLTNWRTASSLAERETRNPWTNAGTTNQVLRPHRNHLTPELANPNNTGPRFDPANFPGLALTDPGPDEGIWTLTGSTGAARSPGNMNRLLSDTNYDYDIDTDGDGIKDAIFLDLDFPVGEFDDGGTPGLFTIMTGMTVIDADGLLNVNAHGNPTYFDKYFDRNGLTLGSILNMDAIESYSSSSSGLSPFEVNITRGLYADPRMVEATGSTPPTTPWFSSTTDLNTALEPYRGMFQFAVNSYVPPGGVTASGGVVVGNTTAATHSLGSPDLLTNVQMANLEFARLVHGSFVYDSSGNIQTAQSPLLGRYGDETALETYASGASTGFPSPGSGVFPAPGSILEDDDVDNENGGGRDFQDPDLRNLWVLPTFHPVDLAATGNGVLDPTGAGFLVDPIFTDIGGDSFGGSTTNGLGRLASTETTSGVLNPSRWPAYGVGWQNQDPNPGIPVLPGRLEYNQLVGVDGNPLQPTPLTDWNLDEADELIVEPQFADSENDQVFPVSEMMGLHLDENDYSTLSATSRLRSLLPFNFDSNADSKYIRRQFTTSSWDRMEFSFRSFGSGNRAWEFSDTQNLTRRGNTRFPPRYVNDVDTDPFRVATRQLLMIENGRRQTTNIFLPQRRLRFDQIIDSIPPTSPDRAVNGDIQYRNLTPHPAFQDSDPSGTVDAMWHGNTTSSATPPPTQFGQFGQIATNKFAQEWWARYDRQRLARDIFVLLYTLGGGDDSLDLRSNAYPVNTDVIPAGSPPGNGIDDRVDRMAQFAVNIVDSMDRDSVITKFEYDGDLSDGWNNPSEVAYGVEAQELTFSELMWLVMEKRSDMGDHPETLFDDSTREHQYLFMELRNATPKTLSLEDGSYRIRRVDGTGNTLANLTFETGTATANTIGPGENFLIGTTGGDIPVSGGGDDGEERAAVFRMQIDYNNDGASDTEYRAIVPSLPDPGLPDSTDDYPDPMCDLDLSHQRDRNQQKFAEHGSTVGYFLPIPDTSTGDIDTTDPIRLVLERRQSNTSLGKIADADNDWVEVDSAEIAAISFDLGNTFTQTQLYDQTAGTGKIPSEIISRERRQPFNSAFQDFNGANRFYKHSFGGPRIDDPATLLASFTAPSATRKHQANSVLSGGRFTIWQPHFDRGCSSIYDVLSVPVIGPDELVDGLAPSGSMSDTNVAGSLILNPGNPASPDPTIDNRWYRALEFFEVDTLAHTSIRNQLEVARLPGKINLNTIRNTGPFGYLSSLSALIDDDFHVPEFSLLDRREGNRHWGDQFLVARDGFDPVWANNSQLYIPLPGTPASKPFRPLDYLDTSSPQAANASAQHTILRKMPFEGYASNVPQPNMGPNDNDQANPANRRQLFEARTVNDLGADNIDFHSRHRLLSKIANNSTTRSNVFFVWIAVQFHRVDDSAGYYQVGEKLTTAEDPRFVTRRGFFVVDRSLLEEAYDPNTRKFDFRKFVVFRKTISGP